jgi:hypothetical protein
MVRRWSAVGVAAVLLTGFVERAAARSLTDKLHEFINITVTPLAGVDVLEPVSPVIQRVGIRGADFPVTSTTPGFTYTYDPDLGMFQRSSGALGSAFLERAETVGRRRFALGFSYLYADLTDEDGENFADKIFLGSEVSAGGATVAGVFSGEDFSLVHHVFGFSGTYGITNRWDVNLFLPLVYTSVELEGRVAQAIDTGGGPTVGQGTFRFSDLFDNEAFGVGDILLRTKYRFWDGPAAKVAGLLTLRLPSGDEDDFQGLGDVTVTPVAVISRALGTHEIHGQLGVEANADDLERSRARYGIGGTFQVIQQLGLFADLIGSSSFVDDEFEIPKQGQVVPDFNLLPNDFVEANRPNELVAFVPRSDLLDLAVGLKLNIAGTAVAFVSAIVPLTDDGLRADVVPAGGIEVTF